MDLAQVERLCRVIASPASNPHERMQAHHQLLFLQISADYIDQCRYILEHSTDQVALMYAAESIIKVMRRDWANISPTARIGLRDFLVGYFLQRASNPRHFLTRKIIQVLCELTRRAWCEDARHHTIIDQCVTWMRSPSTADLGLRMLADLVTEFDQGRTAFFDEATRRAAQAFREQESGLAKAFYVSVDAVAAAHDARNAPLLCESLRCLLACLSFDFASTGADESAPGISCVYLPKSWVQAVASESAIGRLFALYIEQWQGKPDDEFHEEAASLTLQCLVLVAGTRRTSHDNISRSGFVRALMTGVEALVRTRMGMDRSEDCTHHTCRLIARMKTSMHPAEMSVEPIYSNWLLAVRDFTCDALRSWLTISPRSINYLLEFWMGMVTSSTSWQQQLARSMSPQQGNGTGEPSNSDPYGLSEAVSPIVDAYLTSRANICECSAIGASRHAHIESALSAAREAGFAPRTSATAPRCDLDEVDPLASEEAFIDEIGLVLPMIRARYAKSAETLGNILIRATSEYSTLSSGGMQSNGSQARIAFCMYLIGALVGAPVTRDSSLQGKQIDDFNMELAAFAFRVVMERKMVGTFQLEMSILYFIQCFQFLLLESRTRAQVARMELRARRAKGLKGLRYNPSISVPASPSSSTGGLAQLFAPDTVSATANGSADDFLVTKSVELFPKPMRRFDADLLDPAEEEVRAFGDADEDIDELPPLVTSDAQLRARRNRHSADLEHGTPVIVDEFDAMESDLLALDLKRATAVQRTIADRVGVQGGDRALLEIAIQHVFSVLQMPLNSMRGESGKSASNQVRFLVERALGVLRKLAQGSSVVHAGIHATPKIVSSGLLLLESEFIQDLLKNPNPDRFALLCEPEQGRARSFFVATLTSLFFLHCDSQMGGLHGAPAILGAGPVVIIGGGGDSAGGQSGANGNNSASRFVLTPAERAEDAFSEFMRPFTEKCDLLMQAADLRPMRSNLISLLRDLRGVCSATEDPRQYDFVFAWFFPNRIHLLRKAALSFPEDSGVTIPLLRLLGEMAANRGSRISFPVASGGGLALMLEISHVLLDICRPNIDRNSRLLRRDSEMVQSSAAMLSTSVPKTDSSLSMATLQAIVEELSQQQGGSTSGGEGGSTTGGVKLFPGAVGMGLTLRQNDVEIKCMAACATALTRMVNGRYASLSAFQVFGDTTMKDLKKALLVWGLTSPPEHVQGYPKFESAFVLMAHTVADTSPMDLIQLPTPDFARLVSVLAQAVVKPNSLLSTPAAFTIETLATMRCRAILYGNEGAMKEPSSGALALRANGFVESALGATYRVRSRMSEEHELRQAWGAMAQHDMHQPNLFADLLTLLLDRVLTAPDADLTNLYALVRPLPSLACSTPSTLATFINSFVSAQAQARQASVNENLEPIMRILLPGANSKEHIADCLRRQEEYTKELCKLIRRFRDFYWRL